MRKLHKKYVFLWLAVLVCLISVIWTFAQYQDVAGPGIPVLLYHGVSDKNTKSKYVLAPAVFERQLQFFKKNGYQTILPSYIVGKQYQKNPKKTIILTFDDGLLNNYQTVFPLLKKYGFKAIFFIITGEIGKAGRINARQLKEMVDSGMELGSHTITHPFLDTLSEAEITRQIRKSKLVLEKISGVRIVSLAPPGGWFDNRTTKIARQNGYKFLFGCEIGLNDLTRQPFIYKRIEILRGMSLSQFRDLLVPFRAFGYKLTQACKFILHSLIGTSNYVKLSHALR